MQLRALAAAAAAAAAAAMLNQLGHHPDWRALQSERAFAGLHAVLRVSAKTWVACVRCHTQALRCADGPGPGWWHPMKHHAEEMAMLGRSGRWWKKCCRWFLLPLPLLLLLLRAVAGMEGES